MENAKVHVWYDATGNIIAVGRPLGLMHEHITPITTSGIHEAILMDVQEDLLESLHETHKIDVKDCCLVPCSAK